MKSNALLWTAQGRRALIVLFCQWHEAGRAARGDDGIDIAANPPFAVITIIGPTDR